MMCIWISINNGQSVIVIYMDFMTKYSFQSPIVNTVILYCSNRPYDVSIWSYYDCENVDALVATITDKKRSFVAVYNCETGFSYWLCRVQTMDKKEQPTDKLLSEVYKQFENDDNGQELAFLNAGKYVSWFSIFKTTLCIFDYYLNSIRLSKS